MVRKIVFCFFIFFNGSSLFGMIEQGIGPYDFTLDWSKALSEKNKSLEEQPMRFCYEYDDRVYTSQQQLKLRLSGKKQSNRFDRDDLIGLIAWFHKLKTVGRRPLDITFDAKTPFTVIENLFYENVDRKTVNQFLLALIKKCPGSLKKCETSDGVVPLHIVADLADEHDTQFLLNVLGRGEAKNDPVKKGLYRGEIVTPLEIAIAGNKSEFAKIMARKARVAYKIPKFNFTRSILNLSYNNETDNRYKALKDKELVTELTNEMIEMIAEHVGPTQEQQQELCRHGKGQFDMIETQEDHSLLNATKYSIQSVLNGCSIS